MRNPGTNPISIVLLLRGPCRWSKHELVAAAERAWSDGQSSGGVIAKQSENKTVLISPPHIVTLLNCDRPYLDEAPHIRAKTFPEKSQQEAWARHTAWIALDYHGVPTETKTAYGVLSGFVVELLDANCTGVFIPGESSFIPNDESLGTKLRAIARER